MSLGLFQLALLQEEWRGRSLSSQLMTGAELEESSITDGFQHPRVRSDPAASTKLRVEQSTTQSDHDYSILSKGGIAFQPVWRSSWRTVTKSSFSVHMTCE